MFKFLGRTFTLFNFESPMGFHIYGGVAQLGEHLPCKQGVRSSILLISTRSGKKKLDPKPAKE